MIRRNGSHAWTAVLLVAQLIAIGISSSTVDAQQYPGRTGTERNYAANRLTGTYRLNPSRSDDVITAVNRQTRGMASDQQQRVRDMVARRLDSPDMLALERSGRNVTVASSRGPQVSFDADGRTRTEQTRRGRNVSVTAMLRGDQLLVSSVGDRGNDYRVTFEPIAWGRGLRVTRRMDIESLPQPVTVISVYDKTSDIAQLDLYTPDRGNASDRGRFERRDSSFIVPNDARVVARLDRDLSTTQAREGDRFTLTVDSPPEYAGAVIEGNVGRVERSGRVSGRAQLALNLERIRLRNGNSYPFYGDIEDVRMPGGDTVNVDREGRVTDDESQTGRTLTRTGIGTAIGAVIGAIAGGGKGAAIGAAVGAGAGAGSVFIQGRDDLNLPAGTRFTIRTNTPRGEADR